MSYILDALRRAEAERERGKLPGLHTRAPHTAAPSAPPPTAQRSWLIAAVLGLSALGAVLLWWLSQPATLVSPVIAAAATELPDPQGSSQPPGPAQGQGLGSPAAEGSLMPAVPPVDPAPLSGMVPGQTPVVPVARPRPVVGGAPQRGRPDAKSAAQPSNAASASTSPPPATPPKAVPSDTTVVDLPIAMREELPKFSIGGSVYSEDRGSRFLIVNGEVMHEGDTLAPGLTIEQIRPREAWLRFRGYRVRQPL